MNSEGWIDRGSYLESSHPQRSPGWFRQRHGRVSSTLSAGLSGLSEYVSVNEAIRRYVGEPEAEFDDFTKDVIEHGTKLEPNARKFYTNLMSSATGCDVCCSEPGFCVSKAEPLFGASPDGIVTITTDSGIVDKGVLEIKCPKYGLYEELQVFLSGGHPEADPESAVYDKYYHEHVKIDHYIQMQQHMFVTGTSWCDYVVYTAALETPDEPRDFVVSRIWYNSSFFDDVRKRVRTNLGI